MHLHTCFDLLSTISSIPSHYPIYVFLITMHHKYSPASWPVSQLWNLWTKIMYEQLVRRKTFCFVAFQFVLLFCCVFFLFCFQINGHCVSFFFFFFFVSNLRIGFVLICIWYCDCIVTYWDCVIFWFVPLI